jgi:hypothetical protein
LPKNQFTKKQIKGNQSKPTDARMQLANSSKKPQAKIMALTDEV